MAGRGEAVEQESERVEESNQPCPGWGRAAGVGEMGRQRQPSCINVYAHPSLAFS